MAVTAVYGGTVVTPDGAISADLLIRDGSIAAVGIGRNGTRDVRSENLTWATVEPVQVAMLASGPYRRVVIELPPAKGRGNPKTDLRQFRAPGRKCGRA